MSENLCKQGANKSPIIRVTSAQSVESNRREPVTSGQIPMKTKEEEEGRQLDAETKDANYNNNDDDSMKKETNDDMIDEKVDVKFERTLNLKNGTDDKEMNRAQEITLASHDEPTHAYKMRWFVLAIFCSHSAINSFQWIQYSSITNIITNYYGVSNLEVNLTSLVYMITYIPFIIHASLMLERVGLRSAICLGAAGTAVGSLIKLQFGSAATPQAFWAMMVGQTIVALSQLYIISIPPLLAAVWFPDHQVSTATGIGVFGNQLGIALGFIVPPLLVSSHEATKERLGYELYSLTSGVALLSIAICIIAFVCLKDKPPKPPGSASLHAEHQHKEHQNSTNLTAITDASCSDNNMETFASICELCREKDFQLLTISYGINVGCFYAVSTVLNQMVAKKWPNPDDLAGTMGLLIVVSGMAGSVMCGQLLDRTHAYKLIIVLIYLMSLVSMLIFTLILRLLTGPWLLYIASITLGFFMTGYLPLGFEFAAEITYPHPANTPAGLLNLSAQIFGLGLTYASSLIVDKESGDLWANLFLTGCLLVGLVLTAIMKADLKRQKAVAEEQMKI